jgi:hypothetical protein
MASQLNVKDQVTIDTVKRVASRRGVSVTRLLRTLADEADRIDLATAPTAEDIARLKRGYEEFARQTAPIAARARELGMTSDHRWIYEDRFDRRYVRTHGDAVS